MPQDAIYVAYFAPYSFEMHQDLVARTQMDERVSLQLLGETLDGHDIDMLQIGACSGDRPWVSYAANWYAQACSP